MVATWWLTYTAIALVVWNPRQAAGMPVEGSFRWGDEELRFTKADSFATLDWTRSHATRETTWKWASFAGLASTRAGDVSVGLNLSAEVYEDKENAFWLNGKVSGSSE